MARDRITNIRIKGLRTLKDVNLRLNGLHVLIGENGTGKSSTIEAIEICRRLASPSFFDELNHYHGGMRNLFDEGTRFF